MAERRVTGEEIERTSEELERLRQELDEANRHGEEYLDLLRRARADFANFKRRVEQERTEQARNTKIELILRLLPVVDDFERALAAAPRSGEAQPWLEGIALIERKLKAWLESEGIQRIQAEDAEFNPWLHEAVDSQTSPELEDGRILHVVRPGYRMGDTVIRPAQVIVAHRSG